VSPQADGGGEEAEREEEAVEEHVIPQVKPLHGTAKVVVNDHA